MIRLQKQKGLSLLEILVTVVILSVGLLGLASMQLQGTQSNQSAWMRSQASFLAYDIIDRMRNNRALAINQSSYKIVLGDKFSTPSTNCTTADCTPAQMAEFDVYEWDTAVKQTLPDGEGEITFETGASGSPIVRITVWWQDSRHEGAQKEPFVYKAEL